MNHDRTVKASNELGLHWQRANTHREPFNVLLNLELSQNNPRIAFNPNRKVKILAPDNLFELAMNKQKNFTGVI